MKLDTITNKQKQSGFIYENSNNQTVDGILNPNDEYYTPRYAIEPLLKYLKPNSKICCPFDTIESNYYNLLSENNHNVATSHLHYSEDFFQWGINYFDSFDYIISNPPYSLKFEVFKMLFEIGKPFATLVGLVGLFESQKRFNMFKDNDFEVMYFDKRIAYFKDYSEQKPSLNPPFSSVYICHKMLPNRIVFETLTK